MLINGKTFYFDKNNKLICNGEDGFALLNQLVGDLTTSTSMTATMTTNMIAAAKGSTTMNLNSAVAPTTSRVVLNPRF